MKWDNDNNKPNVIEITYSLLSTDCYLMNTFHYH